MLKSGIQWLWTLVVTSFLGPKQKPLDSRLEASGNDGDFGSHDRLPIARPPLPLILTIAQLLLSNRLAIAQPSFSLSEPA